MILRFVPYIGALISAIVSSSLRPWEPVGKCSCSLRCCSSCWLGAGHTAHIYLVVVGRHVDRLQFLHIMLGDQEVFARPAGSRLYSVHPGYSKLDEAATIVLAQGLRRRGYGASAEQSDAMSVSRF